jgi:predicted transcriptional regulator
MSKKSKKIHRGFLIAPEVSKQLDGLADKLSLNKSKFVENALKEAFKQKEVENNAVQE